MADLYLDSEALRGFSGRLTGLTKDFSAPVYTSGASGKLDQALRDLSASDARCGQGLNNFLTALAGYTDTAATAAEKLDEDLAKEPLRSSMAGHGRVWPE
jgi:hypothetical protein